VIALPRPVICVVTPGHGDRLRILAAIAATARAGATLIQIREPGLDDRALFALVSRAVEATAGTPARVVVNDRADVAMAASAAGVHLRGSSVPASRVRALAPPAFLIGRSVHAVEEARAVEAEGGCDYLVFGTVFPSASKPAGHRPAGLSRLREVCDAVALPVLAIGGLTEGRAPAAARAGAAGLAAIGLFADPESAGTAVAAVRRAFDTGSALV
jgi:thiamine-phosphate pyrophosphorylase